MVSIEKRDAGAEDIVVRSMQEADLGKLVEIDAQFTKRRRPEYFALMLRRLLRDSELQVCLVADIDKELVGFLFASIYYGEFGVVEPAATLDAIGVSPAYRRQGIAKAMMRQLRLNLAALRVQSIRSEVFWNDISLLSFFHDQGFSHSQRLCLEMRLDPTAPAIAPD